MNSYIFCEFLCTSHIGISFTIVESPLVKTLCHSTFKSSSSVGSFASKIRVAFKLCTISFHYFVPLCTSNSIYQSMRTMSSICINLCTHSCCGTRSLVHATIQFFKCVLRYFMHEYLSLGTLELVLNLMHNNFPHYYHPTI